MGGGKDRGGTREGEESGLARPWGLLEHTMLHLPITQGLLEHRRQAIILITHRGTETQAGDSSYSVDTLDREKHHISGRTEVGSDSRVLQATWGFDQSKITHWLFLEFSM